MLSKRHERPPQRVRQRTVFVEDEWHKLQLGLLIAVIIYIVSLLVVSITFMRQNPSHIDPVRMCEDMMGVPAEYVEYDEYRRFLVWVGDGQDKYCYAFVQDNRWIVSGQ